MNLNPKINGNSLTDLAIMFAANTLDDRESLTEFSAGSRISPPVLMERAISQLDPKVTHSINHVLMAIYISHYLTVVNRLTKVGNVTANAMLSPLGGDSKFSNRDMARDAVSNNTNVSLESISDVTAVWEDESLDVLASLRNLEVGMENGNDFSKPSNIAVGRTFDVPLISGERQIKIPVTISVSPRTVQKNNMIEIVSAFLSKDNSFKGRYHRFMAGEFSSFWEYAFGLDLIEEDFKLKLSDASDIYEYAKFKQKKGLLSSFLTGKKQMNIASAMIVVTKETSKEIELAMRGSLVKERDRQKFFKLTGSMILVVVDDAREMVRIYQRGIDDFGDFFYDDLMPAATNNNAFDINAIMRAAQKGDAFTMR